jgi:hypothetical protein
MIQKSIFLALSLCLILNSLSINGAVVETKDVRSLGFGINILDGSNPELVNIVNNLLSQLDNPNGKVNEYLLLLNRTNPKAYNQLKKSVEIAKAILGINVTSLTEIAKAVKNFPNDPIQLSLRIISVVFSKELKLADQEVVRRLTLAINNLQDPKLKKLAEFIATNPVLIEKVFGKGITQEPVTRLVLFLSRVI